jgi:hypothetical protein
LPPVRAYRETEQTPLVGLPRAGVSKRSRCLAGAGPVTARRASCYVFYSLAADRLAVVADALADFPGGRLLSFAAMSGYEGGCGCGMVRYRLASEPLFVHCCHCRNCQRQTGSAFVINLLYEADRVELTSGEPEPVEAPRDDGSAQRIYRCPVCQVAVFSEYSRPGIWFVRGGTLDDPAAVKPDVHIFTKSKLPWVTLPDDTPAVEVFYDLRELWPAPSLERLDAFLGRG